MNSKQGRQVFNLAALFILINELIFTTALS